MQKLAVTNRTTFGLSGEKGHCALFHSSRRRQTVKEKSYIPLLLPVDSNLSFKMAHTKKQHRLAN